MNNISTTLLQKLKSTACTHNAPCKLTLAPSESLLEAGSSFRKSAVAQAASFVAGPYSNNVQQVQNDGLVQVYVYFLAFFFCFLS